MVPGEGVGPGAAGLRPTVFLAGTDSLVGAASVALALALRFGADIPSEHALLYLVFAPALVAWRPIAGWWFGLYDFRRRLTVTDHAFGAVGASLCGVGGGYVLLALGQLYYFRALHLSRAAAGIDLLLTVLWLVLSRAAVLAVLERRGFRVRILVAGPEEACSALARELGAGLPRLAELRGILTDRATDAPDAVGTLDSLVDVVRRERADQLILVRSATRPWALHDLLARCDGIPVELLLYPDLDLSLLVNARVTSLAGVPLVSLSPHLAGGPYRVIKRMLDVLAGAVVLLAGLPLVVGAGIGILVMSPGPVFYRQERIGWRRRPFRMVKLRTMAPNAEERTGPVLATGDDPRIIPGGRLLRRLHIDELPQMWNILRGDMSLVGPRPERPEFVARFTRENPLYGRRFLVRPGLTGLAQVHGGYACDYARKLRYDLIYAHSMSLATDLRIVLATVREVLTGHGAA